MKNMMVKYDAHGKTNHMEIYRNVMHQKDRQEEHCSVYTCCFFLSNYPLPVEYWIDWSENI